MLNLNKDSKPLDRLTDRERIDLAVWLVLALVFVGAVIGSGLHNLSSV